MRITPDLREEKETALNEAVEMRLTTVDFSDKERDKVVVLFVVDCVTSRVEMSGVDELYVTLVDEPYVTLVDEPYVTLVSVTWTNLEV